MGRLISLAELAVRTSTCESTWRKKIARGELPVIRIGRSVRVDEAIVELLLTCGIGTRPKKVRPEIPVDQTVTSR